MSLSDDLARLHEVHRAGGLTDEEFAAAKARLLGMAAAGGGPTRPADETMAAVNAMRRPQAGRWLGGVCVGLAAATGLDAWVWRLLFVLLALWGGAGLLVYLLLWIFVPGEAAPAPPAAPPPA
ncbi:MAG: PspC domain-containing protein [Rubrivivax sp.]|nr:PspC domain-containing protein [Rubrivivax sp.]